jgi:polysaccharide export outer membrane protein
MNNIRAAFFAVVCALLAACAGKAPPLDDAGVSAASAQRSYLIGVDDHVQISVWRNPELSVTVPVRPDGKISVPLVGDVDAGGRTPEQVAALLRQQLARYIREPNVTVIVAELRSHEFLSRVRVTGAVVTPRSMNYRQGMTVLDAVLEAGGINKFASANRTKLYRKDRNLKDRKGKAQVKSEVYDIDLEEILNKGRLETNHALLPGDVITVPERTF